MSKCLVVVDMQNDFIDGVLKNEYTQSIVEPLSRYIENFDGGVLVVMDIHDDEEYSSSQESELFPIHCIEGEPGWSLNYKIHNSLKSKNWRPLYKNTFGVVRKNSWNFLDDVDVIEIAGVYTDVCVISNALILKSWFPNKKIKILSKLCAGTSALNHATALTTMAGCQIEIV